MQNLVIQLLSKLKELGSRTTKFGSRIDSLATVLALNGDLGTGKTAFTKALAKELGILEHITSPTFVIQKSYPITKSYVGFGDWVNNGFKKLVHIDAYRLESGAEAKTLDLQNTIKESGNLVVIEWAENIKGALPESAINIDFEYIDETTREVTVQD